MRIPAILILMITIFAWIKFRMMKLPRGKTNASFWEKELAANNVRKKPLDDLHYITIPINSLPFFNKSDEKLDLIEQAVNELSNKIIVNLSGLSNTDLKIAYGTANLTILTEYDQNYILLVRYLFQWGNRLTELGLKKEAIQVLEYGIDCKTDVKGHYMLLAKLYLETSNPDKIDSLLAAASELNVLMKDTIIEQLKIMKKSNAAYHGLI